MTDNPHSARLTVAEQALHDYWVQRPYAEWQAHMRHVLVPQYGGCVECAVVAARAGRTRHEGGSHDEPVQ